MRVRVYRRAGATALVCLALLAAVYLLAVWTRAGQRFEDAVLVAAGQDGALAARATSTLDAISAPTILAALAVVLAVGALRRRPLLGSLAAGVVAASVLTTEVIQRSVPRPVLLAHGYRREDQSFPSGHTAVAMSLMCALVLVTPYRLRGLAVFLASLGAAGVELGTVTATWHRPSDTIGSDLIVLVYLCAAIAVLAWRGSVREATPRTPGAAKARALLAAGYAGLALAAFAVAAVEAVAASGRLAPTGSVAVGPAAGAVLTAGRALALSGSAAVAAALLALLRRVDLTPPQRADGEGRQGPG